MRERSGTAADAVLGVVPRLVLEPETLEDAAAVMSRCAADRMALAFVGGATDLGLGFAPAELDAVVRTSGLSRLVAHAPGDQVVTAEAGMTLGALQRALASHGQCLALDPPFAERATLGGIVAANAFGPRRTRYGAVRDLILGASLVRADGTTAKGGGQVVKNVAGFDIPRLLVGSLGTLGLLATVTFRVHPLPEATGTVIFSGLDPAQAWSLALAWREAQLEPGSAVAIATSDRLDLAMTFEGFAPGVASQSRRLLEVATRLGLPGAIASDAEAAAHRSRHDAVREGGSFRAKIAAPPSRLAEVARSVLPHVLGELSPCQATWYPTLGLGFASGEPSGAAALARGVEQARTALAALGGTLVVTEAPHVVRAAVDVWGPPAPAFELMQNLKDRLDPDRRLNPGRFVGGL